MLWWIAWVLCVSSLCVFSSLLYLCFLRVFVRISCRWNVLVYIHKCLQTHKLSVIQAIVGSQQHSSWTTYSDNRFGDDDDDDDDTNTNNNNNTMLITSLMMMRTTSWLINYYYYYHWHCLQLYGTQSTKWLSSMIMTDRWTLMISCTSLVLMV